MARRGGYIKAVSIAPDDVRILGGDVIGSDPDEDTKISLTASRAQVIVDNAVKVDAQPTSLSLATGAGQGLQIDASGATVLAMPIRTVTANTTVTTSDGIVCCDTSGGPITVTLPAPGSVTSGRFFYIKDLGSAATNNITVSCASANVGGAGSIIQAANRGQFAVVALSTEWLIF